MPGRKLAFIAPMSWIVLGVVVLAMPLLVQVKDEFGLYFAFAFGAICLGGGTLQFWRRGRADPKTTAYTVDDVPPEKRAGALRRLMLIFAATIIVGSGFTAYQLVQLEYGLTQRATLWGPVAGLYSLLGFWPAVLVIPAVGILGILAMARRLQVIRAAASTLTGSE